MGDLIRVGVLTISDRCSRGEQPDLSGPAIIDALPSDEFVIVLQAVVPDEKKSISDTLRRWCDAFDCNVILTTGGTGLGPRDVTPEAMERVIQKPWANLSTFLLLEGLKQTPFAPLSRGLAGIRGQTLVVNFPGSPSGASDGTKSLLPLLSHAVDVLKAEATTHPVQDST